MKQRDIMTLKEYLYDNRISPWAFAVKIGVSTGSMSNYLNGKKPCFRVACVIEQATEKKVTVEDLRGNPDELI